MGVSLLDLNIFERKSILTDIDIKLCTRIENGIKQLLAIVTESGDIVLHYIFGGLSPVLKHIPWFTASEKNIQSICFDPTATWLLVTTSDVSLYIIPALNIVDAKQKIDCKWSLTDVTYFARHEKTPNSRPLCVIWWQTLDCNQNAIVGHDDGSISFVSLTDGQNIGVCAIANPVKSLHICQDNSLDTVTLLITNSIAQQWRLLLEQRSNGFVWSPDCGNKIQTTVEYAINGLTNGHLDESKTSRSRLQGLKQLSVEKLTSLKQKLAETRSRGLNSSAKTVSDDQKSTGSNDSNGSQSDPSIPEKLSHLYETFLCPQFARNRHLFSGYYKPSSVLTIHGVDIDVIPMFVHKLFPECRDILVTDRFFFITNDRLDCLSIVSCQFSESRLDGDTEFNPESLISQFYFPPTEKIKAIYKVSDLSIPESLDNDSSNKSQKTFVLAKSESELNIRKPKIDTCIIVTSRNVYKISLSCSVIEKFVSLVSDNLVLDKADRLATMFGLSVQQLLEYSGDLLLSQEKFKHAIALYRLSKCRILKSVLKFAVSGHCHELLSYITVCLTAANTEMSVSTKKHLSNLAIMSYTELLLRSSVNELQKVTNFNRFMTFLTYNEYYDEVLAVNVVCQTALWSVLSLLGRIRCLGFDIIEVLCKVMKNPPIDRTFLTPWLKELDIVSDSFHTCISEPMFLQCIVSKPQYSKVFLKYIKEHLCNFSIRTLKRLSNSLDPSQPVAWPVISKVFQKHKCHQSSSLDSTLDSIDSEPPDELLQSTHDLIETFLCILIVLINKMENARFDIHLLNVLQVNLEFEELPKATAVFMHPKPRILSSGYSHVGLIRNGSLYMWGSASAGCLGFGPMVTKYSLPQQVDLLNSYQVEVISVACGKSHTIVLTNFGVYSWGSNCYGQLGLGPVVYQASYPSLVPSLSSEIIIDVSAGQYHSLALTNDGRVYSWGWGVYGQLGHGNVQDVHEPRVIKHLSDKIITQISAGHAHSIVLSSEGVVYSFGSNNFGQLGNGTSTKSCRPVQILLNEKIILIATNYFHNLAVGTDNKLYIWGSSPQVLRHQVHTYKRIKLTQQFDKNYEAAPIDWSLTTPFSIDNRHLFPAVLPTEAVEGQIVQVATGCNHSALLTKDGSLYTWGQNFDGQIGNSSRNEVTSPTQVKVNPLNTLSNLNAGVRGEADHPLKCVYVSCGAEYTIAVDYAGKVLAWGNNSRAQLGKISDEDERGLEGKMVMLKTTKRILKIPKTGQNMTDSPREVPNIPTLHITYRNHDKYATFNRNMAYYYPLPQIENTSSYCKLKNDSFVTRKRLRMTGEHSNEVLHMYGQKTLHHVLQTYFGFYDTELILHKCVDYNNFQAASKISYLDGHFSDSLGFQLSCFKLHMDSTKWRHSHLTAVKCVDESKVCVQSTAVKTDKLVANLGKCVNPVSVISTSCSLESIKQFNDDLYSQGGFEEMCGEELSFLGQKVENFREISVESLNTTSDEQSQADRHTKVGSLKSELIDKLEFKMMIVVIQIA
ncbi:claret [Carabus blaptoides fortunei]